MNVVELNKLIKIPLSDSDLKRFLGNEAVKNTIKYSELKKFKDFAELLPEHNSYKIILIEYEKNRGHWVCVMRYNKVIELFNSYGTKHDDDDFVDSDEINYYLGQSHNYINIFIEKELDDGIFQIIYNKTKFQVKSIKINNCGRHVVNRLICLLHYEMTLKDYVAFMKKSTKATKLNYDQLVTAIIN